MTNERKVDGWCAWHPEDGYRPWYFYRVWKGEKLNATPYLLTGYSNLEVRPVRIVPADSPTPAEAAAAERKRVIGELREWAKSFTGKLESTSNSAQMVWYIHIDLILAKLAQLEGGK